MSFTCVFCKKKFNGYGNNPRPVKQKGFCCIKCNEDIVIPMRFKLMQQGQ